MKSRVKMFIINNSYLLILPAEMDERLKCLNSLISSEQRYLESLKTAIEGYAEPLR